MEATRADIEQMATHLVARSHLVEKLVHGHLDWFVAIGDELVRAEPDIILENGGLMVHFFVRSPQADADKWIIYADEELMHVFPGSIVAGKPARLRLWFAGTPGASVGV